MTTAPTELQLFELRDQLQRWRYPTLTESALQANVELALRLLKINYRREWRLSGEAGRVDFWLPDSRLFIECKISQPWTTVLRQLSRYCEASETAGGLLITRKHNHRDMPTALHGKPLAVLWVGGMIS